MDVISYTKAKKALQKADYVQQQLNQAIANGDQLSEVQQARVDDKSIVYATLKERIDANISELRQKIDPLVLKTIGFVSVKQYGAVGNGASNDQPAIQSAINDMASQGGGVVYIPPGTYLLNNEILLKYDVALVGAGINATILKLGNDVNKNVITVQGKDWNTRTNQSIQSLTVHGNKGYQSGEGGYGIYFSDACMHTLLQNVRVTDCKKDGIKYVSSHNNWAVSCVSEYNDGSGWTLVPGTEEGTSSYTDNHAELVNCIGINNNEHGFKLIKLIDAKLTQIVASNNGQDGLFIDSPTGGGSVFTNLGGSYNGRDQIRIVGGVGVVISDVRFHNTAPTGFGIHIIDGIAHQISNARLRDGLNNIRIESTAENILLSNITAASALEDGIYIEDSRACSLSNIVVYRPGRDGIRINRVSGATDKHMLSNIHVVDPAYDAGVEKANAIKIAASNVMDVVMSHVYLTDTRGTKKEDYAIDLGNAQRCVVTASVLRGVVGAVANKGTSSVVDNSVIEYLY